MERLEELRAINRALGRISRTTTGRVATRTRAERSGVEMSRPALAIVSALRSSGPVRLTSLARLVDLEPPLISREVRELYDAGVVERTSDPDDGRVSIVGLTPHGRDLVQRHRDAIDSMTLDAFEEWSMDDIRTFRELLDRALAAAYVSMGIDAPIVADHGSRLR